MAWASVQCEAGDHPGCREIYAGMVCECRCHAEGLESERPVQTPSGPKHYRIEAGRVIDDGA